MNLTDLGVDPHTVTQVQKHTYTHRHTHIYTAQGNATTLNKKQIKDGRSIVQSLQSHHG